MTVKKKRIIVPAVVVAILLALIIWIAWGNTALELNTYTVSGEKLPEAFDGYRVAHVSDLHNAEMGKDNEKLLDMLRDAEPDIIAITGDLIDSRKTDIDTALQFAEAAMEIAPCYYVTGNHEARVAEYDAGLYTQEYTNMIVSRGIVNSIIPFRFNNRPEVVLVKLKTN